MNSTNEITTTDVGLYTNGSNTTAAAEVDVGLSRVTWIKSTMLDCYFYSLGVIIPTGLLCNAFCLTVCALSHGLRRTTTGHYLMALAIADSLFLIGDLIRWLNSSNYAGQYR